MSESYYETAASEQIITVRFWKRTSCHKVVIPLLETAQETDLSLLTVLVKVRTLPGQES